MNLELAHAIWTALLALIFVGIVAWAWSARQRGKFEAAARVPLEDDAPSAAEHSGDTHHG